MGFSEEELIKNSIGAFTKTIEIMMFSLEISNHVKKDIIKPEWFAKKLVSQGKDFGSVDWEKNLKGFKTIAKDVQFASWGYAIIFCKQVYFRFSRIVIKDEDSYKDYDLYSAQMILKILRDAFAHILPMSSDFAKPCYRIDKKNIVSFTR